jgi:hypothetical protein
LALPAGAGQWLAGPLHPAGFPAVPQLFPRLFCLGAAAEVQIG